MFIFDIWHGNLFVELKKKIQRTLKVFFICAVLAPSAGYSMSAVEFGLGVFWPPIFKIHSAAELIHVFFILFFC